MKAEPVRIEGTAFGHVRFVAERKHGNHMRYVEVEMDVHVILKLADCIRGCPEVYEDTSTGDKPTTMEQALSDSRFTPRWTGHAVWHVEHPERLMPCLPQGTKVIDVPGLLPAKDAKS